MAHLAKILLYPIKSLDGLAVTQAKTLESGALQHDRELALVDDRGKIVNGKRSPQVHLLRSTYDLNNRTITLQPQGSNTYQTFHLDHERSPLEAWLSNYFGFSVRLIQDTQQGFPDDLQALGPTIISTATLETVSAWFPDITVDEMRRRLRTNLEIEDVPAFWEDQLFGETGHRVPFQIGPVRLEGMNPCQRCVVPTRQSYTGTRSKNFQTLFVKHRQATLPSWTTRSRFDHFFRLAINTQIHYSEAGKTLNIGDEVKLLEGSKVQA